VKKGGYMYNMEYGFLSGFTPKNNLSAVLAFFGYRTSYSKVKLNKKELFSDKRLFVFLFMLFFLMCSPILAAVKYATNESFEGQGWNAKDARGFTPGLKQSLNPEFAFNQLQGNHSFVIEKNIVRNGKYSAKLVWKHTNPAQYNGNVSKVDNVDRKAMFHGFKTSKVKGAHAWYGFSVYFPKEGTQEEDNPWLFFQIHSSQDHQYPTETGRNPPFSIRLNKNGFVGRWKWDPEKISDGKKTQGETPFVVPVKKEDYLDRWVDFVLHVRFDYSNEKNGIVELWIDGEKVIDEKNTRIGYNDDKGLYPSWGMYWNSDLSVMKHDHYLYMDELRNVNGTATYADVAPRGSKPNENVAPSVNITSPANNASFELGERITLSADANDPDGTINNVNFRINDEFYNYDGKAPFSAGFTPSAPGSYKISAVARDNEELETEVFVTITVTKQNEAPVVTIKNPTTKEVTFKAGDKMYVNADVVDENLEKTELFIDGKLLRQELVAPYEWGDFEGANNANELDTLAAGSYTIKVIATDKEGLTGEASFTLNVQAEAPTILHSVDKVSNLNILAGAGGFRVTTGASPAELKVTNIQGQVVFRESGVFTNYFVPMKANGVYFIELSQGNKRLTQKYVAVHN